MNSSEAEYIQVLKEYCEQLQEFPKHYQFRKMLIDIRGFCNKISFGDYYLTPRLKVKELNQITKDVMEHNMTQAVFIEAITSDPFVTKNVIHKLQRCEKVLEFLLESEQVTPEDVKRRMTMLRPIFNSLSEEIDGDFGLELSNYNMTRNMLECVYHIYDNVNVDIFTPKGLRMFINTMINSGDF